jgi:glycosyltransferase involved in cell wall biosynthesis
VKVLIVFNAGARVYGLERSVIELFDLLRPEVDETFLMSRTTQTLNLPILQEINRRNLHFSFFSDTPEWPRIRRPRSLAEAWQILIAAIKGNLDVMRTGKGMDVIYIPGLSYFFFALIAAGVFRFSGRKVIYQFHDLIDFPSGKLRFASVFITDFVHNSDVGLQAILAANRYLKKKQHHVIPCPYVLKGSEGGASANGSDSMRNILFIGQVSKYKGVDILLDAFERVRTQYQDVVLNIVGGCDDPLLAERLSKSNGSERVKWWGYQEDVTPFLRNAYLYVQPSPPSRVREAFGMGLVEAMAAGVPSVCFRSGALQEIMIHEQTGILCDSENPRALAESIERLLKDKDFRDSCGKSALLRFRKHYSALEVKIRWLKALGIAH